MLIVPANQTYKVVSNGTVGTYKWYEARMPLAVAVGGASGGGETTDILPVLYSGMIKSDGTIISGTGFTATKLAGDAGQYEITFDTPRADYLYSVNAIVNTGASRFAVLRARSETGFQINIIESNGTTTGRPTDGNFQFSVIGQETIAVGGGSGDGKTVAFKAGLSADQTVTNAIWNKVELNTIYTDIKGKKYGEDADIVDGKFKPSVAGWYQVNGAIRDGSTVSSTKAISGIRKNGDTLAEGSFSTLITGSNSLSNSSTIVYLNGLDDYVELWGLVETTGTAKINGNPSLTSLSAVLVSGGSASGGGTPSSFARIVDEKPEGTDGGSAVAGNNIRNLNKVVYDDNNIVTVADNSFTLQEGTYAIEYSAPTHMVKSHKVSLRNITDGESVSQGTSEYTANETNAPASVGDNRSFGKYVVTLTKPTTYQLFHYAEIAKVNNGLGLTTGTQGAPNVYATVDIQKVGSGGSASGDSIWTESGNDLFYVSPNFNSGLYLNSQEDNNINLVGYNGTDANDLWIRSGGAPNKGIGISTDSTITMRTADASGDIIKIIPDGRTYMYGVNDNSGPATPNTVIGPDGQMFKSTTAMYTADDVDKRLAIKDKLIEKLSARLDELEKKVK